jgi:alkaline phosphatase D
MAFRFTTVGAVTATTARLAFGVDGAEDVYPYYAVGADVTVGTNIGGPLTVAAGTDFTGKHDVANLLPDTLYSAMLWGTVSDFSHFGPYMTFRTAPAAGSAVNFSFAFGSCLKGTTTAGGVGLTPYSAPAVAGTVFTTISGKAPSFLLHLGDLIYADHAGATTLAQMRSVHRDTVNRGGTNMGPYGLLRDNVPGYYMIDDHDTGTNDFDLGEGNATYLNGKQAAQEYQMRGNPDPVTAGKLYFTFSYGDVGFFVADGRSFRSTNISADTRSKTWFGEVQKKALKAWLLANATSYKVKFIAVPEPMSGYSAHITQNDALGVGFRTEVNELLEFITRQRIGGVVFLAGDQHWAGLFKVKRFGRSFYEMMATPFSFGSLFAKTTSASPEVLWVYDGLENFGFVTVNTRLAEPTVRFELYDANGVSRGDTTVGLNTINAGMWGYS